MHILRAIKPCRHYIRPVTFRYRLGLLFGRKTCVCYWGTDG